MVMAIGSGLARTMKGEPVCDRHVHSLIPLLAQAPSQSRRRISWATTSRSTRWCVHRRMVAAHTAQANYVLSCVWYSATRLYPNVRPMDGFL